MSQDLTLELVFKLLKFPKLTKCPKKHYRVRNIFYPEEAHKAINFFGGMNLAAETTTKKRLVVYEHGCLKFIEMDKP